MASDLCALLESRCTLEPRRDCSSAPSSSGYAASHRSSPAFDNVGYASARCVCAMRRVCS